jgi:hypothetical protein
MDIKELITLKNGKVRHRTVHTGLQYRYSCTLRWELVLNISLGPFYPREGENVPILNRAGWAPGPVRTGAEHFPLPILNHRSFQPEWLYELSYPVQNTTVDSKKVPELRHGHCQTLTEERNEQRNGYVVR